MGALGGTNDKRHNTCHKEQLVSLEDDLHQIYNKDTANFKLIEPVILFSCDRVQTKLGLLKFPQKNNGSSHRCHRTNV